MPLSSRVIKGPKEGRLHLVELRRPSIAPPGTAPAVDSGEDVLERAREEAARLVAQAQEMLDDAAARREALVEEARREGYAAGEAEAARECLEERQRAARVLAEAEEERRVLLAGVETEVVDLALAIARKVVARELAMVPAAVMAIAREALELVSDRERVTVYVNPAEADLFRARRGDLEGSLSDRTILVIIADKDVEPGGVRVETEQGLVDAGLEVRFAAFRTAFADMVAQPPGSAGEPALEADNGDQKLSASTEA